MIYTHTKNLFDKSQTKKKHSQKRDKKILPFPKRGKKYYFFRREGKKQKRALSLKIARPHARVEEKKNRTLKIEKNKNRTLKIDKTAHSR